MKFIEYDSDENSECSRLKAEGWFVAHVVPGIGGIRIACMTRHSDDAREDIGLHVWKGDSIVDDCSLCGQRYAHESHA